MYLYTYIYVCNCKTCVRAMTLTLYSYVIYLICISYMHVIYIFHMMSYFTVLILCLLKYIERSSLFGKEFCSGNEKQNGIM